MTEQPGSAGPPASALRFHGDAELAPGLVDLAVNVRTEPPPRWLSAPVAAALADLARYPDDGAARHALAARHGRRADEVLPTAGAAQAFTLLGYGLRPRLAAVVHPQFTEPEAALLGAGVPVRRVLLRPDAFALDPAAVPDDADLVLIGNPTNPTSVLHAPEAVAALARPGRVLVVDEAFADTVPGEPASLAGRADLPGLVVIRSLTKTWGLAGLRIGYVLAAPDLIRRLADAAPLWPVSTPALAAAVACAAPEAVAAERRIALRLAAERAHLVRGLAALPGVTVAGPPASSFVLIRLAAGTAGTDGGTAGTDGGTAGTDGGTAGGEAVRLRLRERGYAVRRGDTFPGLGPDWLRLAVRDPATSDVFLHILSEVLCCSTT